MIEDPGSRRQRRPPVAPWIVLALFAGLMILTGVALFRPAPRFEAPVPVETPLTTRQQVEKDQTKFAADEAARRGS